MKNTKNIITTLTTLRDYIRWGTSQFNSADLCFAQGMPSALDEAVYLCLYGCDLPPDFSQQYFDCVLTVSERECIIDLLTQRIKLKKPAAYITNEAWFAGLSFKIDPRALIPRSPMAELIQQGFSPWLADIEVNNILDLCTGCGCIAVACAYAFKKAKVDASDISKDALQLAKVNVKNHALEPRLNLIESDLFSQINKPYDIIISNPPYVSEEEVSALPEEFCYEPKSALVAGKQGLDIVLPLLVQASDYLTKEGLLVVEVGYSQMALEKALPRVEFTWIEFSYGGEGVFVFNYQQLQQFQPQFEKALAILHATNNKKSINK